MGLLSKVTGSIFGKAPKARTSSGSKLSPSQQAALDGILKGFGVKFDEKTGKSNFSLQDIFNQVPEFSGEINADKSGILQSLFDDASVGGIDSVGQARSQLLSIINEDPTEFDDFFRSSVADPARNDFLTETLPELDAAFRAADPFGSDRGRAINEAFDDFNRTLEGNRAQLAFETEESQKDRALTATQDLAQLSLSETELLAGLGNVEQGLDQGDLDRELALFLDLEDRRARRIKEILGFTGLSAKENIVTNTPGRPGLIDGIASGAGLGIGKAIGGLFS